MKTNREIIAKELRQTALKFAHAADLIDGSRRKPVQSASVPKRSRMSVAARKRIAAAQKARWAKFHKAQKKAA